MTTTTESTEASGSTTAPPFTLSLVYDNEIVFSNTVAAVPSVGSRFFATLPDGTSVFAEVDLVGWTLSTDRREVHARGRSVQDTLAEPPACLDSGECADEGGSRARALAENTVRVQIRTDDNVVFFRGELPVVPRHGDYVLGYIDGDPSGVLVRITHSTWYMVREQGDVVDLLGERYRPVEDRDEVSALFGL